MVCAKRIECSETSGVSDIRRILDSMIWFQRDCDEETRRLSSQVTRYAFTSDDRRSATGMLNLCRRSECIRPSRALAPPPDGIRFSRTGSTRVNIWFILSSRCSYNYDPILRRGWMGCSRPAVITASTLTRGDQVRFLLHRSFQSSERAASLRSLSPSSVGRG
jgi:hypothetical protein